MAGKLTRGERRKRARGVRAHLARYQDMQLGHMQKAFPDHEDRAWSHLVQAHTELNELVSLERQAWEDRSLT